MKLRFGTSSVLLGLSDSPFPVPKGLAQWQPPGTVSRDRGAGLNTQQVTGVQAPGIRLWHSPGVQQSRAVSYCTSPSPLQQLPAHFPELLLLEGALESPDFAELLEVISEDRARNVFQCIPAKADSEVFGETGLGLFLHHCPKENKPKTLNLSAALFPSDGMMAEASRHKCGPELNQTSMFYIA